MADLKGYEQLQRRLKAITPAGGPGIARMRLLGAAANREQKLLTQPNKKTGVTSASIGYRNATATGVTTEAKGAARWLEYGTKGGTIIRPKVAKVLAWGGGRRLSGALRSGSAPTHFAMRVVRGATRAYPFMMPGAKAAIQKAGLLDQIVIDWNNAA